MLRLVCIRVMLVYSSGEQEEVWYFSMTHTAILPSVMN